MKQDEFRFDILKKEIDVISQKINHFDDLRLKTRQMAIVLWAAIVGFGLKNVSSSSYISLYYLATLIPLPFWYIEASYRRYYKGWSIRFNLIRKFIRDGSLNLPDGTTPSLNDFLDDKKPSGFPLFDYWAQVTIDQKKIKESTSVYKSLFNRKIVGIYFPMVIIGGFLSMYKLNGLAFIFSLIFLCFLTLLVVIVTIKYNSWKSFTSTK